jgi:hypothetical protein
LEALDNDVSETFETEASETSDASEPPVCPKTFEYILEHGSENHIKWLLTTSLMSNIVSRFDGVVFGGAVRDSLRHSYASRMFYSELKSDFRKLKLTRSKPIQEYYDDPTLYPEYSDRFLLPTDIDFFIKHNWYELFKRYIYRRGFYYKEVKRIDLSYINTKCAFGQYRLVKAEIMYFNKNKSYPILLDVILCDEVVIPQMDDDLSVNKLLMTHDGIVVSPGCEFDCHEIISQINNKIAFCNSTISEKRYEKLNKKGWKITLNYSTFIFKLRTNPEEENCIICLDPLKVGELEVLPRHCKCKYSYCNNCLNYSLKSDGCLMCKKKMCLHKKECDLKMYEKYKLLND